MIVSDLLFHLSSPCVNMDRLIVTLFIIYIAIMPRDQIHILFC